MATLWESTTFIRAGISSRSLHLYTSRLYPCTRFSLQSLSRDQILGLKMELSWERQNKVNMSSSEDLIKFFHDLGATTVAFVAEVVEILANSIWPLPRGLWVWAFPLSVSQRIHVNTSCLRLHCCMDLLLKEHQKADSKCWDISKTKTVFREQLVCKWRGKAVIPTYQEIQSFHFVLRELPAL